MEFTTQLSEREREVVNLVLQGKGNKQIAWLLGISISTVEFHLKNIYSKYQVRSRIELILKLGNTPGEGKTEQLGYSIVGKAEENTHNLGKNAQSNCAISFRENASKQDIRSKVKSLLKPRFLLMATMAVISSGFFWGFVFAIFIGKTEP